MNNIQYGPKKAQQLLKGFNYQDRLKKMYERKGLDENGNVPECLTCPKCDHDQLYKGKCLECGYEEGIEKGMGEGSRGGKVIGHTKSGKPIYDATHHSLTAQKGSNSYLDSQWGDRNAADSNIKIKDSVIHNKHEDFDETDHIEASKLHSKIASELEHKHADLLSKYDNFKNGKSEKPKDISQISKVRNKIALHKQASQSHLNLIEDLNKSFMDDLEKGVTGKKLDTSHLVLKEVNVNGKMMHRWVDPNKGNQEHAEHGSRVELEHKGEKVKGTVGSVLKTGEYGIKLDDGRTVAKHPHQFKSPHSEEKLKGYAEEASNEGLKRALNSDDPKIKKIAEAELKSRSTTNPDNESKDAKTSNENDKTDNEELSSKTGVSESDVDNAEEGTGDINRRFKTFGRFVRSVVTGRGGMKSMIAYGTGGVGKTYTVEQELKDAKKREFKEGMEIGGDDYDYVKITGKATTAGVYQAMYEHNGKILVFDDCDTALTDTDEGLFKGALDTGGDGTIAYASQRPLKDSNGNPMPSRFSFKGRCVFVSNLPPHKVPQPLKSRSLRIDMTMTPEQTIDRIKEIAKDPESGDYKNLKFPDGDGEPVKYTHEELKDIIDFLDKYKYKTTDLNVRTIGALLSVMKEAKEDNDDDWQHDAKAMLFSKSFSDELNKAWNELETL